MFRKKISTVCFAVFMAVLFMAGCGGKEAADAGSAPSEATESETAAIKMERAAAEEKQEEQKEQEEEDMAGEEADAGLPGPGSDVPETGESDSPGKKAEAFAEKIQEAVADRNQEALAELLFYPCVFVTGDQETIILEKKEDLLKQNPDLVFGDDLMVAVANVDTASLNVTDRGIVLGEGSSNITFREKTDGSIGITEIRE
ncbi:hypothetical protein AALB39_23820 [Lachnospiraceae bacterium 54-53]